MAETVELQVQDVALFLSIISLSFIFEPKDRQPATLHGPDGRRIVLHSVIYVETLKACDWRWPMSSREATHDHG